MRYSKLGKSDLNVSQITVGTWAFGGVGWGDINEKDCIAALHAMLDNGVNFIDTAPIYNKGISEQVVGKATEGRRDKLIIATKCGVYHHGNHVVKDSQRDNILSECDLSLKNLKTDYIDLYIVHWPDNNTGFEETFSAMESLKKSGKIRYVGVSNFSLAQVIESEDYGDIVAVQPPYSMVNRSQEKFMKWVHDHGIGTMTYGSLGAGILTGGIRSIPKFEENDVRATFYDYFMEPKFSKIMKLLKTLDDMAAEHKVPVSQVVINWSTQKEFVDTAITGVKNPEEANANCACMSWQLDTDEISRIDQAIASTVEQENQSIPGNP